MSDPKDVLSALNVIIGNTAATHQAINNMQNSIMSALHGTATGGGPSAPDAQAALANATAGYTSYGPNHVAGSGAPAPAVPPAHGGPSTGYSQPQAPAPPAGGSGGSGGGSGGSGGGSGGGGGPAPSSGGASPSYGEDPAPAASSGGMFSRMKSAVGGQVGNGKVSSALGLAREMYGMVSQASEQSARYQGMEGSTRLQGLRERGREEEYARFSKLSNLNGLTGDEARQAFSDVTSMGFREKAQPGGMSRHDVLDFMQRNKTNLGMSESESSTVMDAAVRNSETSLDSLTTALTKVSQAAGAAGVNALLARQNFLTMFQGLTQAGAGSGAAVIAGDQATALTSYGKALQNVDTSVQFQQQFQYRAASSAGMSAGAYQSLMRTDPTKAENIVNQITNRGIEQAIGKPAQDYIKSAAAKYGGAAKIKGDEYLLSRLADDWQSQPAPVGQPDLIALTQVIKASTGVSVDEGGVTKWVVGHVLGFSAIDAAKKTTEGSFTSSGGSNRLNGGGSGQADTAGMAKAGSGNTGQEDTAKGGRKLDSAQQAYRDYSKSQGAGFHDPVIERLLSRVKDKDKTKVLVQSGDGPLLVTVAEAIKHFPNEVAAGQVSFVGGKEAGKSFKDVVGVDGDTTRNSKALNAEHTGNVKVGTKIDVNSQKYKDILAANQKAADKNDGTKSDSSSITHKIELGLTKEAKKILNPGGALIDQLKDVAPDAAGAISETIRNLF